MEEILWLLEQHGTRMVEVPIVFVERQHGESKLNRKEAVKSLMILFQLGVRRWFKFGRK